MKTYRSKSFEFNALSQKKNLITIEKQSIKIMCMY